MKLKEKFFRQNGGLMLQQVNSSSKQKGLPTPRKYSPLKNLKRPLIITTKAKSLVAEVLVRFTKEFYLTKP